jgi:hypothetical protein
MCGLGGPWLPATAGTAHFSFAKPFLNFKKQSTFEKRSKRGRRVIKDFKAP